MQSKIWIWINDRIPVAKMLQLGLDEEIPGGASFFFTLGSATLFVFILQMITGIWQLFYYVPTVDHAYDSLNYLRLFVPYGWLIHGLHYWGASAMVVLVGLHMLRVFIWGAYKKPREMTWLIGVILILLTVGLSFTGAALPWDERGYWAAEVGTSIAGTVPFIGSGLKFLLIGGKMMGQLTLSRFFILHTAIIPGIALTMIVIHLIAFRKFGSVGPWAEEKRMTKSDFWPDQVSKDVIVAVLIFILLVTLSAFKPPPFTGPADPLDTTFTPKPEWNFLFLYQALKFFPGNLEVIGTVGIPTLIILIFISLPFLDRNSKRNPLNRPAMMFGGFVFLILLFTLTISGYNSNINRVQLKNIPVNNKPVKLTEAALRGKNIFDTYGCISCHTMSGRGGKVGPALTNESQKGHSKGWIIVQIKNPREHNSKSPMPPFLMLDTTQLSNLADYLLSPHPAIIADSGNRSSGNPAQQENSGTNDSENTNVNKSFTEKDWSNVTAGPAADMIGNIAHGALLFQQDCESCHGTDGGGGIPNPGSSNGQVPKLNPINKNLFSKEPQVFASNIDKIIQHGSTPAGPNPQLHMLDFGDSHTLTQQQIANIEAYILNLNGVSRAEIQITSFSPKEYYLIVIGTFAVASLIFVFIGYSKKKRG
ncbi:MAG: cytochrome b N-terminal domain-containing protein [Ignavibacteriaceae bacterium]